MDMEQIKLGELDRKHQGGGADQSREGLSEKVTSESQDLGDLQETTSLHWTLVSSSVKWGQHYKEPRLPVAREKHL